MSSAETQSQTSNSQSQTSKSSMASEPVTISVESATEAARPRKGPSTFGTQVDALFRKSFVAQSRQKLQLCGQIAFPFFIIILLYILQTLLVTPTIQKIQGEKLPAIEHPMELPFYLQLFTSEYVEGEKTCPKFDEPFSPPQIDMDGGRMYLVDDVGLGTYDPFGNSTGFLRTLASPDPFLLAFKGYTFSDRGNFQDFCLKEPYLVPPRFERVPNPEELQKKLFDEWNQRTTTAGFIWRRLEAQVADFTVAYNGSLTIANDLPLLLNFFTSAVARSITGPVFDVNGTLVPAIELAQKGVPVPETIPDFDLISLIGPSFYVYIFQLTLPLVLSAIVYEKEIRIREIMKMMGLRMSAYWTVTYTFSLFLAFVASMVTWAIAAAFGFRYFIANNGLLLFIFFFLWCNLLVAFSFFLSVFFTKSHTATIVGYLLVFGCGLLSSSLYDEYLRDPNTADWILNLIALIPPFLLFRGLNGFSGGVRFGGTGVTWDNVTDPCVRLHTVFIMLVLEWLFYIVAAFYLEQVLPIGYGVKKHPLFFLGKSFETAEYTGPEDDDKPDVGEDVKEEIARALGDGEYMLKARHLRKVYPPTGGNLPKLAVRDLSMTVSDGECCGFLGPNGAGKTTSINMITGLFQPTSGTAMVDGHDILTDIGAVHEVMGVCPQDNILWGQLTGEEHLLFYGRLKNLKGKELTDAVAEGLKKVNLADAKTINKRVSEYSGGMQRRLSVACSLIGDPKIVLLDEPSTGLDPASRNQLWNIILEQKKRSAMLLTTHAMEEADALCDRVAIFDNGGLAVIGTSAELKSRFPSFKLTVVASPAADLEKVHDFVLETCPTASRVRFLAGTSVYEVDKRETSVASVIRAFETHMADYDITDWGISNTTLEEVFLKVVDGGKGLRDSSEDDDDGKDVQMRAKSSSAYDPPSPDSEGSTE